MMHYNKWNICSSSNQLFVLIAIIIFLQGCSAITFKQAEQGSVFLEGRSKKIKMSYHQLIQTFLGGDQNTLPIDLGDDKAPDLLSRAWSLIGSWVEAYLDDHPDASPDDIASIISVLNENSLISNKQLEEYELYGHAIKLAPEIYAVDAYYPTVGTFFVVARNQQGDFRVLWDIKKVAVAHFDKQDELGRWAYLSSICYGNGPLVGWVHSLPKGINNNPRFYVDATTTGQGGTIPGQISIWEWNGAQAIPLLIGSYDYYVDGQPKEFDGQFLNIRTKEHFKTFFSCGMCPDPQVIWTIRVTPEQVEDLGKKDVSPELRMVDELWFRLTNGMSADDFASQQVISEIKHLIDYVKIENPSPEAYKSLSMLGDWNIMKENNIETFSFTTDNLDCNQLLFEIEQKQSGLYFSHLSIIDRCKSNADAKGERNN